MVSWCLQEDIFFNFKEDTEPLIEKLLLLEYVDFQLSQNEKRVTKMQNHQQRSSDSSDKNKRSPFNPYIVSSKSE